MPAELECELAAWFPAELECGLPQTQAVEAAVEATLSAEWACSSI